MPSQGTALINELDTDNRTPETDPDMQTYLVGGAVRDKLLGLPYHERDWVVVGASPQEMLDLGFRQVGRDFPVFLHPETHEEYALARTERKTGPGYHGFTCYSGPEVTLEDDLRRRDLSINAIAEDEHGALIDPWGGQQDLAQRRLRHVSAAFSEDPLRVLRVARFAARFAHLGFSIAAETLELMREMSASGELSSLAKERIWSELEKALREQTPSIFVRSLQHCGAWQALFPQWQVSIDDRLLQALDSAAASGTDTESRFGLLCSQLSLEHCKSLCQQLRPPNNHSAIARLACQHLPLQADMTGAQCLAMLEALDYLRRPEQMRQLLDVEAALRPQSTIPQQLLRAADICRSITAANIPADVKGPALGKALRQQRLQALEELL